MKSTRPFDRRRRLQLLLERVNLIHCRRRLLGMRTDHLHGRCRRLSAAWLQTADYAA